MLEEIMNTLVFEPDRIKQRNEHGVPWQHKIQESFTAKKKNHQGSSINITENSYHNNQMLGKFEVVKSHLPPSTTTDSNIWILR